MSRLPEPVRRAKSQLRPRYRTLTAAHRSLPDFVIIGTQKAATTSLMRYLKEHPDVVQGILQGIQAQMGPGQIVSARLLAQVEPSEATPVLEAEEETVAA